MNRFVLLLLLSSVLFGSGCQSTYYQVSKFAYTGENQGDAPHVIDHGDITISYDFWGHRNPVRFTVLNKLDKPIMMDFSQSSLIINDINLPYYQNVSNTTFQAQTDTWGFRYVETEGTATTEGDQATVLIAPGSKMTFQEFVLPVPEGIQKVNAYKTIELDSVAAYSFRNFLCYRVVGEDAQPVFIDDAFTRSKVILVGGANFSPSVQEGFRDQKMVGYQNISSSSVAPTGALILGSVVGGIVLLAIIASE
ncbi:MAG: hypothetical protein NWR72_07515 [Bacteroidia bacterium]|nr:hypothetical protein [Bacteroidia bacterium]